jgi:hypothetical protein
MDSVDEHAVRTLLRSIAETAEPPPAKVDVGQARRHGRRRLLTRRAAAPLLTVVAVLAVLTVPRALSSDDPERPVAPLPRPAASAPVSAPERFNPLVPYASFGWLPEGFSENAAAGIAMGNGTSAGADYVSREAAAPAAGHLLYLTVSSRGACPVTAGGIVRKLHAGQTVQVSCADDGFGATGVAPDVNGRPAFWLNYGEGIAWEYASGAWASLQASITPAADEPHSRRFAAENGWVLHVAAGVRPASMSSRAALEAGMRDGKVLLPSAATRALLARVASRVAYGQRKHLVFPFKLTGTMPDGWRLTQASFTVTGGLAAGTGVTVGPAADTSALSVGYSAGPGPAGCDFIAGQSSYLSRLGVQWIYRVLDEPDKRWQRLCSTAPVGGLAGLDVAMDMNDPGSNAPLPGSTGLGGVLGVLTRLRFLGGNPAGWTTAPAALAP